MECMDRIFTLHILMHIRRMATTITTTISTAAMTTIHHITIWDTLHHSTRLISMVNNNTIKTIPLMEVTLILLLMAVPISLKRVRLRLIQMKHPPDMLAMTRIIHHLVLTGIISTFLNSRDYAVLVVSCLLHHHSTPATVKQNLLERPSLEHYLLTNTTPVHSQFPTWVCLELPNSMPSFLLDKVVFSQWQEHKNTLCPASNQSLV
mmetsp:Transcript_25360/g.32445  ORF Transcript_25360/g.32445 Transcript_25360/m.32445 type:complete len:206 (-) Transcript_25360:253-870(-)